MPQGVNGDKGEVVQGLFSGRPNIREKHQQGRTRRKPGECMQSILEAKKEFHRKGNDRLC